MEDFKRHTRHLVPLEWDVLVGRLFLTQPTPEVRPKLEISVWCPRCRACHVHPWPDPPADSNLAVEAVNVCRGESRVYCVALDTLQSDHNKRTAKLATDALTAWRRLQRQREVGSHGQ